MSCFRFIAAEKANYPISLLCRMLASPAPASTPGSSDRRQIASAPTQVERIRVIHVESRQTKYVRTWQAGSTSPR